MRLAWVVGCARHVQGGMFHLELISATALLCAYSLTNKCSVNWSSADPRALLVEQTVSGVRHDHQVTTGNGIPSHSLRGKT
ncbi:uncharacterized protein UV8b_04723 [Ustilaginoidea virens]|uniref:Uncharacterized protein n=1 Tax=Ustilaginoidea virens TaxID=1159556 RepID=A0A8E5MIE1_USTVR|nr:uncharacterized protein UV8b_04723 [Ustilaginoidea virens]QUC20482.1 hypothetical protein UV8b_04723 [Ustilaginoidea virens]